MYVCHSVLDLTDFDGVVTVGFVIIFYAKGARRRHRAAPSPSAIGHVSHFNSAIQESLPENARDEIRLYYKSDLT